MQAKSNTKRDTKVVTGTVRLSYVHLFEPYTNSDDQPAKYSCVALIPKSDKATMAKIRAAQEAAREDGVKRLWGGKLPKSLHDTVKDGDIDADLEQNPEYAGHYYLSMSAKTRPGLVDRGLNEILDSSEIYSGCFARVSANCFPYSARGNVGVSFGLNHVQKIRDGEMLGGRSRASDDFDEIEDDDDEEESLI